MMTDQTILRLDRKYILSIAIPNLTDNFELLHGYFRTIRIHFVSYASPITDNSLPIHSKVKGVVILCN